MKKGLLIPALLAAAPFTVHAAADHSGLYTGPTVQARLGFGGDELVYVAYTNGETDRIHAGDGIEAAVGWHVQPYRDSPFDLRAQVGYRYYSTRNSSNANFQLGRMSWELIPSVKLGAGFWVGAGLLAHTGIKLTTDTVLADHKFDNALGGDFQLGWRWIALTYTQMHYTADTGKRFDASNFGAQFTYSFGWTCCRDHASVRSAPVRRASVASEPVVMGWEEQGPVEAPPAELLPPHPAPAAAPAASEPVTAPVSAPVPVTPDAPSLPVEPVTATPVVKPPVERIVPSAASPSATVREGVELRGAPTPGNRDREPLQAGTVVHLVSKVRNASGVWWFVTATGVGGGWLLESDLGPITH